MAGKEDPDADDRSTTAKAYEWATRIMTICLEMVVPGLVGVWVDGRLGTKVLFALLGFGGGLSLGIWHVIQMSQGLSQRRSSRRRSE